MGKEMISILLSETNLVFLLYNNKDLSVTISDDSMTTINVDTINTKSTPLRKRKKHRIKIN